ncbi:MAG: phosphate ABC transporter substrate-binding protein [Chloroflexota bacterium]
MTALPPTVAPPSSIEGSKTVLPLLETLITAYEAQNPDTTFFLQESSSLAGYQRIQSDQIDMALVSWLPLEPSASLQVTPIARDAIAIVLNQESLSEGLSLLELRDIFAGTLLNWSEVGSTSNPIQVVSRERSSGTRLAFESIVMEDQSVTSTAIVLPNNQAVVDFVAKTPNSIGYVSFTFAKNDEIQTVPIEGLLPTLDTVTSGSYPLIRELFVVTTSQPHSEIDEFITFIVSPTGQSIVAEKWGPIN